MESPAMKPLEIKEAVNTIAKAESVEELDKPEFKGKIETLKEIARDCLFEKIAKEEIVAIRNAFWEGDPFKALTNLITLRKGKNNSPGFELENPNSDIAWVYCYFIRALASMAGDDKYAKALYEKGCIKTCLEEFECKEFRKNKNKPSKDSPTATVIPYHLTLIFNITGSSSQLGKIGDQMRSIGLFPKLKKYTKSKYGKYLPLINFSLTQYL